MKKVWIFNHYAGKPSDTTSLRHYYMSKYLIESNYQTTVFASSVIHNSDINLISDRKDYIVSNGDGIPFVYISTRKYNGNGLSRILNMFDFYRKLFKVTKHFEKPDIIIASSVHPLTMIAGIKIAKKMGIPCICEVRDLWPESFVAYGVINKQSILLKLLYKAEKWIYKKADNLLFTMEGGQDYIIEKKWDIEHAGSIDLKKVFHINNGIDLKSFYNNLENYHYQDKDIDNEESFKLVYTGSIRKANNIECLYKVAKILKEKRILNVQILIWGDGDCKPELMQKVEKEKLKNIIFKEKVDKKYIPSILNRANLLFLEGMKSELFRFGVSPNKLFDYLAAGKPVLSVLDSNYDIILENNCGIVTSSEPEAVYEGILHFMDMPKNEYECMCNNSKKIAEEFDYKCLSEKLIQSIENC